MSYLFTQTSMKKTDPGDTRTAAQHISQRVADLGDWRGEMLSTLRAIITKANPDIVEEWKWNVPVWSHNGIICTGESYKATVKLTFAHGAALADPAGMFNSSLEGNTRRAIDVREGEKVNAKALTALVKAAVKHNATKAKKKPAK